jgi:hypothetical protein
MKRNRKQTPDNGAGFDEAGHVEQTTGFDFGSIYAADEGIDADAVAHAATSDEREAELQRRGLTATQARIYYASEVLKQPLRQIAREIGKAHGTIANELRRAKAKLKAGAITPTTTKAEGLPGLLAQLRDILDSERQGAFDYTGTETIDGGIVLHTFGLHTRLRGVTVSCPESKLPHQVVECVRQYPATLTTGKGWDWSAKLAEVIGATKWGNPSDRKAAREALAILTRAMSGNPVEFARHPAKAGFAALVERLAVLQRAYRATLGSGTIAERVEALQQRHHDLQGFDPAELQRILNREPLAVAVELAATATSTSPDYWRDLARRCPS